MMTANVLSSAPLVHALSRLGIRQGFSAGTPTSPDEGREWNLKALAGRMVEVSCDTVGASLTAATSLVLEAQGNAEPAAWIESGGSGFYPPDVAASGVDLDGLIVVRADTTAKAARAADHLLRSGGFGLVVLDLSHDANLTMSVQSRLSGLANAHHSAVVCLTRKKNDALSIGSLISIRGATTVEKQSFDHFAWEIHVIKDKRRGPGWFHAGTCRGPEGLH
jgi:recombination protein RecA